MNPNAVMTAYTGILFCENFSEFHEFAEKLLDRPIWTHEFASKELSKKLKEKVADEYFKVFPLYVKAPKLLEICKLVLGSETSKDCYADHHGYCQAHRLEPIEECWVKKCEDIIREIESK
jgi:hypothetical protein